MTKVDELRLAHKIANDELNAARAKASAAHADLLAAELEETGLSGHLVEDGRGLRFVVQKRGWTNGYVKGPIIKKDGTIGARQIEARTETLTDHGEFISK